MTNNLNEFGGQGIQIVHWCLYDTVSKQYIAGTSGTLASGEDSGMGTLQGASSFSASIPEAVSIPRPGDNGNLGNFQSASADSPTGTDTYVSFNQTFDIKATDRLINAVGPHDVSLLSGKCQTYTPVFFVVNSPAMSDESGSEGENGWVVEEYYYAFAQPLSVADKSINTAHNYTHKLTFNERGTMPWGEAITAVNYGVDSAWKSDPYWSPYPVYYQTYVGDGASTQTFTLDKIPVADDGDALQIWEAGVSLVHSTNYAVSTTTGVVTFVGTDPADGAFAVCKVMYNSSC